MYAMQYRIALPADYDMAIIRRRVSAKGSLLDNAPGLGVKAYLVRECTKDSPVNEYAPFYLWTDVTAMGHFIWGGGGFQGIVKDFGRPAVRQWAGVRFVSGSEYETTPSIATLTRTRLVPDIAPMHALVASADLIDAMAVTPGVHSSALALNPTSWELAHFTLWSGEATTLETTETFTVLHLSTPHINELAMA